VQAPFCLALWLARKVLKGRHPALSFYFISFHYSAWCLACSMGSLNAYWRKNQCQYYTKDHATFILSWKNRISGSEKPVSFTKNISSLCMVNVEWTQVFGLSTFMDHTCLYICLAKNNIYLYITLFC
jgi:hypothetical protein